MRSCFPPVFCVADAKEWLSHHYKAPLKALAAMEKSGALMRLKRGVYAFRQDFSPLAAAVVLHGPSYVSFETALAHYGLIPERVEVILSVVDGRPLNLMTPAGQYIFHSQSRRLFALGMGLEVYADHTLMIAVPEKAVLDTLSRGKLSASALSAQDILDYALKGLRIEEESLKKLSLKKMQEMAPYYRNSAPRKLIEALL